MTREIIIGCRFANIRFELESSCYVLKFHLGNWAVAILGDDQLSIHRRSLVSMKQHDDIRVLFD